MRHLIRLHAAGLVDIIVVSTDRDLRLEQRPRLCPAVALGKLLIDLLLKMGQSQRQHTLELSSHRIPPEALAEPLAGAEFRRQQLDGDGPLGGEAVLQARLNDKASDNRLH